MGHRGVGFLFAMILLFLAVVTLKETGRAHLAVRVGFTGALLLTVASGWFLVGKWRSRATATAFGEDGDVAFSGAVFLLCLIALVAGVTRASNVPPRFLPVIPLCLTFAGPLFRRYTK
jgi:hypothetical protein